MRVLVADDSGVIRSILVRILRSMGVQRIVEASDGLRAWESFEMNAPDLVLTDWHMPFFDGLELTKRIRAVNANIPIIMITVVDSKACVIEAIQAGVNDYLCKPFERHLIEAKLELYIPIRL